MGSTSSEKPFSAAGPDIPDIRVTHAGKQELFIVANGIPGDETRKNAESVYDQIVSSLRASGIAVVRERIFGSLSVEMDVRAAREEASPYGLHQTRQKTWPLIVSGFCGFEGYNAPLVLPFPILSTSTMSSLM